MARTRSKKVTSNLHRRVVQEYIDIGDIKPYDLNPRDNEAAVQSVANSIRTFGFVVPIIIDKKGTIVAGHTRYDAAIILELTEVPIIRADHLTSDQIKQFRIIDNKVSELARWDFDLLAGEISSLAGSGVDFTEFGFGAEEIDCLTDMVADDCLSAGAAASMEEDSRSSRKEHRAPNTSRRGLGEVVFFIPQEVYRRWMNHLRAENDFNEADIITHFKQVLGIVPYEISHRRENG